MRFGRYEPSDKSNVGIAVTFLLIGMGAGALVALLLAPKSGKQLRRDLRRKYEGALDTLDEWKDEAKERAEDVLHRGAELAEEVRGAAREKVAPLGRALRRE
ncbi:MAG TPA: YtxH domain-containing protein [Terriglobales bacterium]|jgi:gas vesicle protein|nr:YtxH domain-containing protein [Terriglobales bacterium]